MVGTESTKGGERLAVQVVEEQKAGLGDNDPHTLTTSIILGKIFLKSNQLQRAKSQFTQALEVSRKMLRNFQDLTLVIKSELAGTSRGLGLFMKAQEALTDILELQKNILGTLHQQTIDTLNIHFSHYLCTSKVCSQKQGASAQRFLIDGVAQSHLIVAPVTLCIPSLAFGTSNVIGIKQSS